MTGRAIGPSMVLSDSGIVSSDGGEQHHLPQTFTSDYTVRALTDVTYLRISRFLYQAARSATLLERAQSISTEDIVQTSSTDPSTSNLDQESADCCTTSSNRQSLIEIVITQQDDGDKKQPDQCQQFSLTNQRQHSNGHCPINNERLDDSISNKLSDKPAGDPS